MSTGQAAGADTHKMANNLIQLGAFSDKVGEVANYGVAPDFVCGDSLYLPPWVKEDPDNTIGHFLFVQKQTYPQPDRPAFYLAILRDQDSSFACVEAFDVWMHPEVSFEQFKAKVVGVNANVRLQNNIEANYTTYAGNRMYFVIWKNGARANDAKRGARILSMVYGSLYSVDALGNAGNVSDTFLNGGVLSSPAEAVIEIRNPYLNSKITLDMSDKWHPRRITENGEVEEAGLRNGLWHEVWVDFDWKGLQEADFFHPFNTVQASVDKAAEGATIKIMPGVSYERKLSLHKKVKLVAPIGDVTIN
jgi:hypothetical protein